MSPAGASSSSVSIALTRSYALAVDDHELLLDAEGVARPGEAMLHARGGYPCARPRNPPDPWFPAHAGAATGVPLGTDPPSDQREHEHVATAEMTTTRLEELLGDDADSLLNHRCETIDAADLHLPGPGLRRPRVVADATARRRSCATSRALFDHGRLGGTRLRLDPARRPGHRALGRRELRAEPDLLRPREHREARDRGRLQRASPRRSACSARSRASTRTGSRSS